MRFLLSYSAACSGETIRLTWFRNVNPDQPEIPDWKAAQGKPLALNHATMRSKIIRGSRSWIYSFSTFHLDPEGECRWVLTKSHTESTSPPGSGNASALHWFCRRDHQVLFDRSLH